MMTNYKTTLLKKPDINLEKHPLLKIAYKTVLVAALSHKLNSSESDLALEEHYAVNDPERS